MNVRDYRFLLADSAALRQLIADCDSDDVIMRAGFEERLRGNEEKLAAYQGYSSVLSDLCLTFSGEPVVGNRGMSADFFSDAVGEFVKAVHYVGAGHRQTPLPSTGVVPFSEDYRLLVTGFVHGSFGIRVEQMSGQMVLPGDPTWVESAIAEFNSILEASVADDERLADAVGEVDPRALGQVSAFLRTVSTRGAVCALGFQGREFRFRDLAQLVCSETRLGKENIRKGEGTIEGEFMGFFPHRPRAQLRIDSVDSDLLRDEVGKIITARVPTSVADAVDINSILNQKVRLNVFARAVGAGRICYVVTGVFPDVL